MNLLGRFESLEACLCPLWELDNGRGSTVIAASMTRFVLWATHLYCSSHIRGWVQSTLISVLITDRILESISVFSSHALTQLWHFGLLNIGFLAHLFRRTVDTSHWGDAFVLLLNLVLNFTPVGGRRRILEEGASSGNLLARSPRPLWSPWCWRYIDQISNIGMEFPSWLSRVQIQLVSMKLWIQSLALLSKLRIQHFCQLWYRLQTRLRFRVAVAMV